MSPSAKQARDRLVLWDVVSRLFEPVCQKVQLSASPLPSALDEEVFNREQRHRRPGLWLFGVFFLFGATALIYQIAWQRVLFRSFGVDMTSITIVITAFMLGLGIGSLAGGGLSRMIPQATLALFAIFEFGIGLFDFLSLDIFAWVTSFTSTSSSYLTTGVSTFLLIVLPTTMMGATLPLLVCYTTRLSGNVGRSVGALYCVNTLGGAMGCFIAAGWLLGAIGLTGTVQSTAIINIGLGLIVLACRPSEGKPPRNSC